MAFETNPEYLTIEQAAAYLGVSPAAIRRLLRRHGFTDFMRASISKQVLIRRADLDAMDVEAERQRASTGRAARGGGRRGAA